MKWLIILLCISSCYAINDRCSSLGLVLDRLIDVNDRRYAIGPIDCDVANPRSMTQKITGEYRCRAYLIEDNEMISFQRWDKDPHAAQCDTWRSILDYIQINSRTFVEGMTPEL